MNGATGFLWPTEHQMLLLRAALSPQDDARQAYARWCDAVDLSGPVDPGSLGLLPLVHANLDPRGGELPHSGLIAGVRRRSFVETQRASAAAGEALALLAAAGVPGMVTKGVPLAHAWYANPGLRPMADADILVEPHRAEEALAVLETAGWRCPAAGWAKERQTHLAVRHAVSLRRGPRAEVDLHWRPLHEDLPPDAIRRLWSGAVPIIVGGTETLRPDATSMLMHVLLHGLRRNEKAPLRWVPDSLMILARDRDAIDWPWLVTTSRRARMFNRLGLALRFLEDHFAAGIPAAVLAEAEQARPSVVERLENQFILGKRQGAVALNSYRLAILLRLLLGRERAAVPRLLWRKLAGAGAAARA